MIISMVITNTRVAKKPGNLEFDYLGKKKNLEKPGILYKSHGKTWNFVQKSWKNLEFFLI